MDISKFNLHEINEYLTKHEIKPSFQRTKIFNYLIHNRVHPSVNHIYSSLIDEIPSLSKTTIYNTLKLFMSKGLLIEINVDEVEARYDIDTTPHGHFKCIGCNEVYDFTIEKPYVVSDDLDSFSISEYNINLKGLCKKCL